MDNNLAHNVTHTFSKMYAKIKEKDRKKQEKMGIEKWKKRSSHAYARKIGIGGILYLLLSGLIILGLGKLHIGDLNVGVVVSAILLGLLLSLLVLTFVPATIYRVDDNFCGERPIETADENVFRMFKVDLKNKDSKKEGKKYLLKTFGSFFASYLLFFASGVILLHQFYYFFLQQIMYNPTILNMIFSNATYANIYHQIMTTGLIPIDTSSVMTIMHYKVNPFLFGGLFTIALFATYLFFYFSFKYANESIALLNQLDVQAYKLSRKSEAVKYSLLFTVLSLVPIIGYILIIRLERELWEQNVKNAREIALVSGM